MRKISEHYKEKIPTLKRLKIKSDGCRSAFFTWVYDSFFADLACRSQYKGRKNFWEIGVAHITADLEQWHDFPASHHYAGPHDNAGKVPRSKMAQGWCVDVCARTRTSKSLCRVRVGIFNRASPPTRPPSLMPFYLPPSSDVAFEKQSIYDYHCCYEYCKKYMAFPNKKSKDVSGTWGCNGSHFWLAFSNGEDLYKDKYEAVPASGPDVSAISGSNELYSFRGASSATDSQCTVKTKFMQCYCAACRGGSYSTCPSRCELGYWKTTVLVKTGSGHRRTRSAPADEACQHCNSTDAGEEGSSRSGT